MTQPRPPAIAVDTTEFFGDAILSQSAWSQMRLWALKGQAQLWIPEVVVRETVRHYLNQLDQHLRKLTDTDDALLDLAWDRDSQSDVEDRYIEVCRLKSGYEKWLRERLGRVGATILPLPHMPHDEIVDRMLREEKPFRVKGGSKKGTDGYRDMLIWASIAEHAAAHLNADDTLIFVTRNHTDFCDEKQLDTVALVLRADLSGDDPAAKRTKMLRSKLGDNVPTVKRFASLEDLRKILPTVPEDAVELKMQDDLATDCRIRRYLLDAVHREGEELAGREIADLNRVEDFGVGLDFDELRLPLESPRLQSMDVDLNTVCATVYGTDPDFEPGLILARVTALAEVHIEGYIHVSEHEEASGFSVSLVNDHMYEAQGTRLVTLHFNARIDLDGTVAFLDLEKAVPAP